MDAYKFLDKIKSLKSKFIIIHTIIFVLLILFSSLLDGINKSVIIEKPDFDVEGIISLMNLNLKGNGLRNSDTDKEWYDSIFFKFYKKLHIYEKSLINKTNLDNILSIKTYYCTVKINEDLNRLNNKEINVLFNDNFLKGISNKISFKEADTLSVNERILIKNETGEPLAFYKYYTYKITNRFNKEFNNHALKIKFDDQVNKPIILGFAGDAAIEETAKESIEKKGIDFAFKEVKHLLGLPDIMSVNLEFCITDRGEREIKSYNFRSSEEEFKIIATSPIDYVCIANNHIKDYGETGINDTINYLNKYNISYSGGGENINEAFKPVILKINNTTFSYFSICEVPDETNGYKSMKMFKADENSSGVAFYDIEKLKTLFKIEKDKNNIIIIQYHTGFEYRDEPNINLKNQARKLIDIGADAVICHHPHVVQGMEIYNEKIIAYSLGDFLFDIDRPNADEGIILNLYVLNNKISAWSFFPTISHSGSVILNEKRIIGVENRFLNLTSRLDKFK